MKLTEAGRHQSDRQNSWKSPYVTPFTSVSCPLLSARIQTAKDFSDLFANFCTVRSFEKEDFLEISHPILFCLIKKRSF